MVDREEPFEFRELGDRAAELRKAAVSTAGQAAVGESAHDETPEPTTTLVGEITAKDSVVTGVEYRRDGSYTVPDYSGGPRIVIF